jgi:hypothetical protein
MRKLASDEKSFEITPWTTYDAKIVPCHTTDRLIVFGPPINREKFGCIRVRDKDKKKLWDVVQDAGVYVGLVPAECAFEAMWVNTKIITPK